MKRTEHRDMTRPGWHGHPQSGWHGRAQQAHGQGPHDHLIHLPRAVGRVVTASAFILLLAAPAQDQESGNTLRLESGAEITLEARNPRPVVTIDPAEYARQRASWFNSLGTRIRYELPQPGREGNPWPRMDPESLRRALQARQVELRRLEFDRGLVLDRIQDQQRRLRAIQRLQERTEQELRGLGR